MIPPEALDDRLGFVGTSGSGKTYCAGAAAELILELGHRVVIVDPLDVWWGLRLMPDGKTPSPHNVVIFGGAHGDLPLTENAGAVIGETVATMPESCIVSLGDLGTKAADRRFMLAFLNALYRRTDPKRQDPFHMIFDEADLWAPQKSSEPLLQSRMEEIVRRGRIRGFIPWLITQRPAVLSKDVLSQVDGLVAMKLTASQDRDAIGEWITGQADKADGKRILAELPTMSKGEGVLWLPGHGVLDRRRFPKKRTFDSSRTPRRGERQQFVRLCEPLDLSALRTKLLGVTKEVRDNDPTVLRADVDRLSRELAEAKKATADPANDQWMYECGARFGWKTAMEIVDTLAPKAITAIIGEIREKGCPTIPEGPTPLVRVTVTPSPIRGQLKDFPGPYIAPEPEHPCHPDPARRPAIPADPSVGRGGLRRMLIALAQHGPGLNLRQLALHTGMAAGGGGFRNYLGKCRSNGWIEGAGMLRITDAGLGALGDFEPLPRGAELLQHWVAQLPAGAGKILKFLFHLYPEAATPEEIAAATGYEAGGGGFRNYLGRLRTLDLVDGRGRLTVSREFFS